MCFSNNNIDLMLFQWVSKSATRPPLGFLFLSQTFFPNSKSCCHFVEILAKCYHQSLESSRFTCFGHDGRIHPLMDGQMQCYITHMPLFERRGHKQQVKIQFCEWPTLTLRKISNTKNLHQYNPADLFGFDLTCLNFLPYQYILTLFAYLC